MLKGAVQCISIENLTLEHAFKGLLVDADTIGVTLSINGLWSFDAHWQTPPELIRVEAVEGISIANVMGLDSPSAINLVKGKVKQVHMQNVLAKEIDAGGVKVVAVNCPPIRNAGAGSLIDGERVSPTVIPTE